jgi:hypothetical protein
MTRLTITVARKALLDLPERLEKGGEGITVELARTLLRHGLVAR